MRIPDLLNILLDEENKSPIALIDETGKQIAFEQVAVIPYKDVEKKLYCLLKPIDEMNGIADDECIVFRVDTDDNHNATLQVEEDEAIAIEVYERYLDLVEEALGGKK